MGKTKQIKKWMPYNINYVVQVFLFYNLLTSFTFLTLTFIFSKFGWWTNAFSLAKSSAVYKFVIQNKTNLYSGIYKNSYVTQNYFQRSFTVASTESIIENVSVDAIWNHDYEISQQKNKICGYWEWMIAFLLDSFCFKHRFTLCMSLSSENCDSSESYL